MKGESGDRRMRWFHSITNAMDRNLSKLWKTVKDREAWHATCRPWGPKESDTTQQLNNNHHVAVGQPSDLENLGVF